MPNGDYAILASSVKRLPPDEKGEVHIQLKERWSLWVLPQGARADNGASSASVVLDEYNLWGLNHHARLAYKRETGTNFSSLLLEGSLMTQHMIGAGLLIRS